MAENQFLVSVADVKLYDPVTNELMMHGKTLLDSSITQSIQSTAVNGGKGSQKLYEYNYNKELAVSISDAAFNKVFLSLQNNSKILRELADYYFSEYIVLDENGVGTISNAPIGKVSVENENGTFTQLVANGTTITYPTLAGKEVEVSYVYKAMMDTMVITGKDFPKVAKMILNADIMTNNGKVEEIQIEVPNFKPDGAMELSLSHDSVSTTPLAGTTLVDKKGNHAYISFKPIDASTVEFLDLAASPQTIELDSAVAGDSETLTIYGIRGGIYGVAQVQNTEVTFVSDDEDVATVDVNGTVTIAPTAVTGDETKIRMNIGGAVDIVEVIVV